jgi:hypothetical protein
MEPISIRKKRYLKNENKKKWENPTGNQLNGKFF